MRKGLLPIMMLVALSACQTSQTSQSLKVESSSRTMLIMAEDGDEESISRKSRVSTRILNELVNQLDSRGFDVYDETAVTLSGHSQESSRRSDAQLLAVAKSIRRPPIDVVVFFRIFYDVTRKEYQNEVRLRIEGRLLSVSDGRHLGSWEAKLPEDRDQVWLLPNHCFPEGGNRIRECVLEAIGSDARILAQEVGAVIADKLNARIGFTPSSGQEGGLKRGFNLVFDGFSSSDYGDMEKYLTIFSGYIGHRPVRSSHLKREVFYESTISTSRLERNLHKMLEVLGLPYVLKFSGNTYTIKAKNLRKKRGTSEQQKKYKW